MKPTSETSKSPIQLKWWSRKAIVYFIAAGTPPIAIKIGVTQLSDTKKRIGAFQTGNHEALELIGVIPFLDGEFPLKAAEDEERKLHIRFSHWQRFPEGTRGYEWFTASDELITYVHDRTRPPEELGLVRFVSKMTGPKKMR